MNDGINCENKWLVKPEFMYLDIKVDGIIELCRRNCQGAAKND